MGLGSADHKLTAVSENSDANDPAGTLLALGSATLGESGGKPMHPRIRAAWPGAATAGPAYSVTCARADNLAVHAAVVEAPSGSVLVVATDPPERGYWGEVLTTGAEARGIRGLVIDGGVRDVAALEAHRFPVFSALVALEGAEKVSGGEIGGVARVGGVDVQTGDWIVADRDGVTAIAREELQSTIERGRARSDKETMMFSKLREGATTVELLGLDTASVTRS
jgi:4-hydroxy-4-methyl-2-oxoglutarate aldolase